MVTIVTPALHTDLTTSATLQAELVSAVDSARLDRAIQGSSSRIGLHCDRIFPRQVYRENLPGYGTTKLQLREYPVLRVPVPVVAFDGNPVTDFLVEDAAGQLVRDLGWDWTVAQAQGLTLRPVPDSEALSIQVDYTAGYLLPSDNLIDVAGISAAAADKSYNDASGRFPLLIAGDRFVVSGYATAANNGPRTVVSRTATKIIVAEALADEAAPAATKFLFSNLPALLEEACIETAKAGILAKGIDPTVDSVTMSKFSVSYDRRNAYGLPPAVVRMLVPFVRWA